MGDVRFVPHYERLQRALEGGAEVALVEEEALVSALAGASRPTDAYIANVLATELLNRTRRLRTVTDALVEGVFGTDPHGRIRFANPAACTLLRREISELRGAEARGFFDPDDSPPDLIRALDEHASWRGECRLLRDDGTAVPVRITLAPVLDHGDPVGCVAAFEDISRVLITRRERNDLLERERNARKSAEAAERRARFLANATRLLASRSIGEQVAPRSLLETVVPELAEWGAYYRLDGERLMLSEIVHSDPAREAVVGTHPEILNLRPGSPSHRTLETGEPILLSAEDLRAFLTAAELHGITDIIERFSIGSVLLAPVATKSATFGTLALANSPDNPFRTEDITTAVQLSQATAVALENAALYTAEHRMRQRYEALAFGTSHIVWTADGDGNSWERVPAWEAMTGQTYEEMKGVGWQAAIHPDDRDAMVATFGAALKDVKPFGGEMRVRLKDGTYEWFAVRAAPIVDEDGKLREFIGSLSNTQAEHNVTDAIRESEERFRSLADSAPVLMWESDEHANCKWFNNAWTTFTGRSLEESIRTGYGPDVHPADSARADQEYAKAREKREGFRLEYRLRRHDGVYRWMLDTGRPVFRDGEFAGHIGSAVDITDHREAERRMKEFNDELERRVRERTAELARTNAELEAFTQSVSHDLRAPLRGVDFFAEALEQDFANDLDEEGRDMLSKLRGEAARAGRLVQDLLQLSSAGREPIKPEPIDVSQMARTILEGLQRADPERRVDVRVEDDLAVSADPVLFRNVMENLLENAWKFTAKTREPRIEVRMDEGALLVRDNGAGFDPAQASRLFRPFQRLHSPTEFEGTGLGLATVARIIERHGGSVRAEGAPNAGATIRITLPKLQA